MENSANQENIKKQPVDNNQHNIETVTPDIENVHPLSRQESPEELKAANATSTDPKQEDNTTNQQQNTEQKEKVPEKEPTRQDNNQESLQPQDSGDDEEKVESNEENKSGDPRDDIETVTP